MKFLLIVAAFLCQSAFSQQIIKDVTDAEGNIVGQLWTDREAWKHTQTVDGHVVCATYFNDLIVPIQCRFTASALLAEPFTGFAKLVTDFRDETIFFNQTLQLCFNFGKDVFAAWELLEVSDPVVECGGDDGGGEE